MKKQLTKKELKEQKRKLVQAVRQKNKWLPHPGMVIKSDKY